MIRNAEYSGGAETSNLDAIVNTLRLRICMSDPDVEQLLYENKLAAEFGVSRTPIRYALQRLSYEHLVQTRSGVGSVVAPLDPKAERRDFEVLRGILELAGATSTRALVPQLEFTLRGLALSLEAIAPEAFSFERHFELRAALIPMINALIEDPILAEAHSAAHWRILRRSQGFDAAALARQHAILSDALAKALSADSGAGKLTSLAATATHPAA